MSATAETRRSRRAAASRSRWYKRWWVWLIIALVLIAVFAVAWIGVRGIQAKQQLEAAMPLVARLKAEILAQDGTSARATYDQLASHTAKARDLTGDPIWRAAENAPWVGANLSATRAIAIQTDAVATGAIEPLVRVSGSSTLESLKPKDGRIDVAALLAVQPTVKRSSAAVDSALRRLKAVDTSHTIGAVARAKNGLVVSLASAAGQLRRADSLLSLVPSILGVDKPRNYLLAFQNNGELMAAGGTIGSMAVIHVDNGAIQITAQSSASPAEFPMYNDPVVPLEPAVRDLYTPGLGAYVQDLTMTPRFSLSYTIAKTMWAKVKGVQIDGMVAVDIVALSQFLVVTGPVDLPDGTQITAANAARTLLIGLYQKYTPAQVDEIDQALTSAIFGKLLAGDIDPEKLLSFVTTASKQHRILLWSGEAAEQKAIRDSPFYGAPPRSTSTTDAFGVYFQDYTPSKLGVYLKQSVKLSQATCRAGGDADIRVAVTLTNTAPANVLLPHYVAPADNHIRVRVLVYAPADFTVAGVSLANVATGADGDYVVPGAMVSLLPGQSRTVAFDLMANHKGAHRLSATVTPAATPTAVTTGKLDCGTFRQKQ